METKIISGNFAASISGTLAGEKQINVGSEEKPESKSVADVIAEAGLTYIVQRDGLSSVYKSLLEKGEKRNTVGFSEENGAKFQQALTKALAPYGNFTVSVEEHVPSEGGASPMVRATALVDAMENNADINAGYRQVFGVQGLADADNANREQLIAFAHKIGVGIQPPRAPGKKATVATPAETA